MIYILICRMLHSILPKNGLNRCAFINPEGITYMKCQFDDEEETDYVVSEFVNTMNFHHDKEFFLAPYWQG